MNPLSITTPPPSPPGATPANGPRPAPAAPTPPPTAARPPQPGARAAQAPRQAYLDLKANVHRKLLNRLNLEALAQADRARAESEIRTLLAELLGEEST